MHLDVSKLQKLVDKMAKPRENGWVLDHSYAPAFFALITPYIKKAAYRSEYNWHGDPEDAFAEVRWEIWRALEKYGPRPHGNLFGYYTLKLKTSNVLRNREKKRVSQKSCLNFVSESLDGLEALEAVGERRYVPSSCAPFDLCVFREEFAKRKRKKMKKRKKYQRKRKFKCKEDPVEVHILAEDPVEKHILLINDPIEKHILQMKDPVERHIFKELGTKVY